MMRLIVAIPFPERTPPKTWQGEGRSGKGIALKPRGLAVSWPHCPLHNLQPLTNTNNENTRMATVDRAVQRSLKLILFMTAALLGPALSTL